MHLKINTLYIDNDHQHVTSIKKCIEKINKVYCENSSKTFEIHEH